VGGGQAPPKDDVRKGGAQASHTPSGVSEMKGSQTNTKNITFHQIVFNFPHLGKEDLKAHRYLLAHFFDSAKQCLVDDPASTIHVALSEEQGTNWGLAAVAFRAGLVLDEIKPFQEHLWASHGYTCKRHQVNKSFPQGKPHTFIIKRYTHQTMRPRPHSHPQPQPQPQLQQTLNPQGQTQSQSLSQAQRTAIALRDGEGKAFHGFTTKGEPNASSVRQFTCTKCLRKFDERRRLANHLLDAHQAVLIDSSHPTPNETSTTTPNKTSTTTMSTSNIPSSYNYQTIPIKHLLTNEDLKVCRQIINIKTKTSDYPTHEAFVEGMRTRDKYKRTLGDNIANRVGFRMSHKKLFKLIDFISQQPQPQPSSRPQPSSQAQIKHTKTHPSGDKSRSLGPAERPSLSPSPSPKRLRVTQLSSGESNINQEGKHKGMGSGSVRCEICDISLPTLKDLQSHLKALKPSLVTMLECTVCGKRFRETRALRQHRAHKHAIAIHEPQTLPQTPAAGLGLGLGLGVGGVETQRQSSASSRYSQLKTHWTCSTE